MHGSDDIGFREALMNLAFIRGTLGDGNDARFIRGRIAVGLWPPAFIVILMLGVALQSALIIPIGMGVMLVGLWLFLERGGPIGVLVRRRVAKES